MYVNNLVVVLCCAVVTVGLTEGRLRRTRRGDCEYGVYQHEGNTCCYCPRGYRVLNHCTDQNETQCERCEDHTFIEYNNIELQCHLCKVCDSNANMDTEVRCSPFSNTVCGCKESYYCEKGDLCKTCYPCDTCEKNGVKQQCTETNNAVCHADAKEPVHPQSTSTGTIVALFDVLGWKTMKRVAQWSGMSKIDIEQQECNHHNDVKEQTYALLEAWYQKQGLHGAYQALINTLHRMKERRTADEIQNIVKKEAIAQPLTE